MKTDTPRNPIWRPIRSLFAFLNKYFGILNVRLLSCHSAWFRMHWQDPKLHRLSHKARTAISSRDMRKLERRKLKSNSQWVLLWQTSGSVFRVETALLTENNQDNIWRDVKYLWSVRKIHWKIIRAMSSRVGSNPRNNFLQLVYSANTEPLSFSNVPSEIRFVPSLKKFYQKSFLAYGECTSTSVFQRSQKTSRWCWYKSILSLRCIGKGSHASNNRFQMPEKHSLWLSS